MLGKFDGIGQQIGDYLKDSVRVNFHHGLLRHGPCNDIDAVFFGIGFIGLNNILNKPAQIHLLEVVFNFAGIQFFPIEKIIDQ